MTLLTETTGAELSITPAPRAVPLSSAGVLKDERVVSLSLVAEIMGNGYQRSLHRERSHSPPLEFFLRSRPKEYSGVEQ
jgi:hypothetical protein